MRLASRMSTVLTLCLGAAACGPAAPYYGYKLDGVLRLNHAQLKGTHNSYHQRPDNLLSDAWDYSHAPLDVQLDRQGVRQFELDVHWLADEERFAVYHLPAVDDHSSCHYLSDCLATLRTWSDAHRGHFPLFVFIEPKDDLDGAQGRIAPQFDLLDADIRKGWPDRLLTPDDVRGKHATLSQAVTTDGWPTLGTLRGAALFVLLDDTRTEGASMYEYTHGLKDLNGRAMFTLAAIDDPFASILSFESPTRDADATTAAAKRGFIVRTLVDDGHGATITTTAERDAAVNGPAHIVSSDYPVAGVVPGYDMDLPGGTPARCHPVTAPAGCAADALEGPGHLQALK